MTTLLLVPLEDAVVFPHMTLTLPVDVGEEERVFLVPRHENEFGTVGTVPHEVDAPVGNHTRRTPGAPPEAGDVRREVGWRCDFAVGHGTSLTCSAAALAIPPTVAILTYNL